MTQQSLDLPGLRDRWIWTCWACRQDVIRDTEADIREAQRRHIGGTSLMGCQREEAR